MAVGAQGRNQIGDAAPDELVANAAGVLLDWDGCASFANRPHPAALRFLAGYGERTAIVSNNSTLLPSDIVDVLAQAGVSMPVGRVILAGAEALALAAEAPRGRTLVLGPPRMRALGVRLGLELVQKEPDLVVLLRDTRFTYVRLERAVQALRSGAGLIVANPDLTHPGRDGELVPETGALLAALAACVDLTSVQVEVVGKPSPHLFRRACAALGVEPTQAVMIGDNPATDVLGARRLGMSAVLVQPGSPVSLLDLLPKGLRTA